MKLRTVLFSLTGGILLLIGILVFRGWMNRSIQPVPAQPDVTLWESTSPEMLSAARHLGAALRLSTVTYEDVTRIDPAIFQALQDSLVGWYPLIHGMLERENVGPFSVLYRWPGKNPEAPAMVLASHLDVVPVPGDTEEAWQQPPFSGAIQDGFVWGRGAVDDKSSVIGMLESVEALLRSGFQPEQTVYLAFGGDEERGGYQGAERIAEILANRGVRASMVLDEGLFVVDGVVPGMDQPVALIGVAEKGSADIELSVEVEGGHSSMPREPTALGVLSRAIERLTSHPMSPTLEGVPEVMFSALAPEMGWLEKTIFSNLWLFEPLVMGQLEGAPSSNALVRTTVAPTMLQAGTKINVLPGTATAFLNVRLRPGDTVASVVDALGTTIGDERIRIRVLDGASEPSPISPSEGPEWDLMAQTMRNVYPEAAVAPALMIARTDSRHYRVLSEHIFKITPILMTSEDLKRVHGVNERISLENFGRSIQFYQALIKGSSALAGE